MSASTAIGMVSESLRNLLVEEMTLEPRVNVTILAPDEPGGDRRINLFLYKVQENPQFKNQDWQVKPGDPTQLVPPPLTLNLFYLLTAYAANDAQMGNSTAHELLGEAMRVLHEYPFLPQVHLVDGLQGAREQLKIMPQSIEMEELTKVWSTFAQPFRLSVLYQISVVQLDRLSASERIMAKRVRHIGVPTVQASFNPPTVDSMSPGSGAVGQTITFSGQHLQGWRASLKMMGLPLVEGLALTGDTFGVTIPGELPAGQPLSPGFYEIRVDISALCRKTFFFEVTT